MQFSLVNNPKDTAHSSGIEAARPPFEAKIAMRQEMYIDLHKINFFVSGQISYLISSRPVKLQIAEAALFDAAFPEHGHLKRLVYGD